MKKIITSFFAILFLFISAFHASAQALPQESVDFRNVGTFYQFGDEVIFQATIQPLERVKDVFLYIQPEGQNARIEPVSPNENGEVIYKYDAAANPLRPFALTQYWFQAILQDDEVAESEVFSFFYEDNRFEWQRLEKNGLQINWQKQDASFGQTVLDVAEQSLQIATSYVPAKPPELLKIYVYENASDVQSALNLGQFKSWVAGHASPDLATVLISAPEGPSRQMELERQIPHEITHILQYQLMGAKYRNAPMWLLEGTASLSELYPNPDYQRVLERAIEQKNLIKLNDLCIGFPLEASSAFLAYAQSESFTRYLFTNYGSSGLEALMRNYADGMGCEEGFANTFKRSLSQEEYRWQQQLGMPAGRLAMQNVAPYFMVLALVLVPTMLSSFRSKDN
jgi:hypothetical protein